MEGDYSEAREISRDSSEMHPTYEAPYVSETYEMWTVLDYNGQMMAYPVSYNIDSSRSAELIISESESITSYDSDSNSFYEVVPSESKLIVRQVGRIDASTLDSLTAEEIDKL